LAGIQRCEKAQREWQLNPKQAFLIFMSAFICASISNLKLLSNCFHCVSSAVLWIGQKDTTLFRKGIDVVASL